MPRDHARKSEARARAAETGESYQAALETVRHDQDAPAAELGVTALPADATSAQRAAAESTWRPVDVDQPCRCSGTPTGSCYHGHPCADLDDDEDDEEPGGACSGRVVHLDRVPDEVMVVSSWQDAYRCLGCSREYFASLLLRTLPWGEHGAAGITVYDNVRHPLLDALFADNHDEHDAEDDWEWEENPVFTSDPEAEPDWDTYQPYGS